MRWSLFLLLRRRTGENRNCINISNPTNDQCDEAIWWNAILLVDEILESADSLGIENIISSIKFLKQSSIIVTHVPKINEEISQIRIIKENGISRLEE